MMFLKIKIADLPENVTPINYSGYWQDITEEEFIEYGKKVIGKMQFDGLYCELKREKRDFLFYSKNPEYAIRLYFPEN